MDLAFGPTLDATVKSLAAGDLDGDGKTDLVGSGNGAEVMLNSSK
jgi:hypothetical protein